MKPIPVKLLEDMLQALVWVASERPDFSIDWVARGDFQRSTSTGADVDVGAEAPAIEGLVDAKLGAGLEMSWHRIKTGEWGLRVWRHVAEEPSADAAKRANPPAAHPPLVPP